MQPLDIPEWKWDNILIDFMYGLLNTLRGFDSIWVIVYMLTKSAHLIPIKITFPLYKLAEIYIAVIMKLHVIPSSIMPDRNLRFTSRFGESLHGALGTKLKLSSAYHPQINGQTERIIQSFENLLMACILEQGGA